MDYVEQLTSDKEQGKQSLFDKLNSLAMDVLSSMKNEGTQVDEAKFINVATSQKEIDVAKKALADSPDMFHGAKAGFKRVITQHQKFIEDQKTVKEDTEQVDEARKIDQFENGIHKATVHKDSETGEYQVKFHTNGKHLKDADYFTDEKDDAIGTAKHQISKMKPDSGFANKVD